MNWCHTSPKNRFRHEVPLAHATPHYFRSQKQRFVTGAQVANAVGVGYVGGTPVDYLQSKFFTEEERGRQTEFSLQCMKHGQDREDDIRDTYTNIIGMRVEQSGFWTYSDESDDRLKGFLGAIPDANVYDNSGSLVGVAEFKAPPHCMYRNSTIPRYYMTQIHAEMAASGTGWCDFMAICYKTGEIMLKRVYFCKRYWDSVTDRVLKFALARTKATSMIGDGHHSCLDFKKTFPELDYGAKMSVLEGEDEIRVINVFDITNM